MESLISLLLSKEFWIVASGLIAIGFYLWRIKVEKKHDQLAKPGKHGLDSQVLIASSPNIVTAPVTTVNVYAQSDSNDVLGPPTIGLSVKSAKKFSLDDAKRQIGILFVDDDPKFKVVKILRNSGWLRTNSIRDVSSLDCEDVRTASVIFVDIQGVGQRLQFKDQGLGLVVALKKRYEDSKKVVIYSAEPKHDLFHDAIRVADGSLPKNADPYQFESMVESFFVAKH